MGPKSSESGPSHTARRHRSLFRTPKAKAHTDPHTDFCRFSSESPADEIDSPPPVFDSVRRAGRLLPLETILWPLRRAFVLSGNSRLFRFTPCRRGRQGFDFRAMTSTEIKKRPGDAIVFSDDSIRSTAMPQDGLRAIHRPQATGDPLSGPLEIKTGSGF